MQTPLRFFLPSAKAESVYQRLALLVLWLYLLSPMLFQPFLGSGVGRLDNIYAFNATTSLLWAGSLHFAVRRPLVLHLALAPFYFTTAVDLFLMSNFGARLSSTFVTIALTNQAEAAEFLSAYARPVALAASALVLVYLTGLYGIRRLQRQNSPWLAAGFAVLLVATYGAVITREIMLQDRPWDFVLLFAGKETSAPFGAVFQTGLALHLQADAREIQKQRKHSTLGATKAPSADEEIYVWVIGETSRPQSWSLFGYGRDTTPRLRALPDIIALPDMLTTAPVTDLAVPSMLSLQPITDWPAIMAQRSIVQAFNETGFTTYWLTTQKIDRWSGLIPQLATEASHHRYFEYAYDGVMLDALRTILDGAPRGGKLFIVLHTLGSHFDAVKRYPPEFSRFDTPGGTHRQRLVDHYDNSVLYTDWFLSQVIALLSQRPTHAALIYASDHGENLLDDEQQLFGHVIGNRYDLSAAAFIWLSPRLRDRHPELAANAKRHATAPLNLSNLSHSLLDLAGIDATGLDRKLSLFNSSFAPRERWYIVRDELKKESR